MIFCKIKRLETTSQGPYIRVGEMQREKCMEGMPGLLLAPSIDVISASLEAKKQESAIEWSRLQQPSCVPLGVVSFFLFLDNRSIISSVQVPLGHLSLSMLRPFRSTLCSLYEITVYSTTSEIMHFFFIICACLFNIVHVLFSIGRNSLANYI